MLACQADKTSSDMAESTVTGVPSSDRESHDSISIVSAAISRREQTLRRQWRLGQNIVLCWSADERGLLVIFVPHYFLGNYCAGAAAGTAAGDDNEAFIRKLISGRRRKTRSSCSRSAATGCRADVHQTQYRADRGQERPGGGRATDQALRPELCREPCGAAAGYCRISLHTPFEQASQLNSLSWP